MGSKPELSRTGNPSQERSVRSPMLYARILRRRSFKKIIHRKRPKHPNNTMELFVLIFKFLQFVFSYRIGFDLAATSNSEIFLSVLGCVIIVSSLTYGVLRHLWYQKENLPYFLSKISTEVIPPFAYISLFAVAINLSATAILQQAGVPRVFSDILNFNMLAVVIISTPLESSSFQRVYRHIFSILLTGILLGIIFGMLVV